MITHHIGKRNSTLTSFTDKHHWILSSGKTIDANTMSNDGISEYVGKSKNLIDIFGSVIASNDAVYLGGTGSTLNIGTTGRLRAEDGVTGGNNSTINNRGIIRADDEGVAAANNVTVHNYGKIIGAHYGVDGDFKLIHNHKGGTITSSDVAIYSDRPSGDKVKILNDGLIDGGKKWALFGDRGDITVINHGMIKGRIEMGNGNDRFDNRGGTTDNPVFGGKGNDTLITDSAKLKLMELRDNGIDTVKSTVSYSLDNNVENLTLIGTANSKATGNYLGNVLIGNSGNNSLSGGGEGDWLEGGRGTDRLTGGMGFSDTFVFATGYGKDTVTDFEDGVDKLMLEDWKAVTSFADLKAHHASEHNGDLLISYGSDTLVIHNFTKAQLTADDVFLS